MTKHPRCCSREHVNEKGDEYGMKKKITISLLSMMLITGTASASSVNGEYKGNPVVNVMGNKKKVAVEDVPAIIYEGRTMVPIYFLEQLGAGVGWDGNTYTVNVTMPSAKIAKEDAKIADHFKQLADVSSNLLEVGTVVDRLQLLTELYKLNNVEEDEFAAQTEALLEQFKKANTSFMAARERTISLKSENVLDKDAESRSKVIIDGLYGSVLDYEAALTSLASYMDYSKSDDLKNCKERLKEAVDKVNKAKDESNRAYESYIDKMLRN